jgi:hypothetical protein
VEIVALVEHLAPYVRVMFPQKPHLTVLLGHELLAHRCDLDVDIIFGQVEIRPEESGRFAVAVPFKGKRLRLVEPVDSVEVEESSKLAFTVVSELPEFSR